MSIRTLKLEMHVCSHISTNTSSKMMYDFFKNLPKFSHEKMMFDFFFARTCLNSHTSCGNHAHYNNTTYNYSNSHLRLLHITINHPISFFFYQTTSQNKKVSLLSTRSYQQTHGKNTTYHMLINSSLPVIARDLESFSTDAKYLYVFLAKRNLLALIIS